MIKTRKRAALFCLYFFVVTVSLYANISIESVIAKTGATFYWDSALGRGYLIKDGYRVTFSAGNKEIILGQKLVYGKVFLIKDQVYFDNKTGEMISAYLISPLSNNYLMVDQPHSGQHQVSVILIDPGHGGRDSGAIGRHGDLVVREKDISLTIGLELERLLKKKYSNKKILMTRRVDEYPTLEERVEMANKQKLEPGQAEIYISIHANATPRNPQAAHGFEVWYLPDTFERKLIDKTEIKDENLRTALDKVIQEEYLAESRRLADFLLSALDKGIGHLTKNRGIRRESWFVVRNAQMAAVLVEIGFVTHAEEAKRLADPRHLKTLSELLYNGIVNFLEYFEQ